MLGKKDLKALAQEVRNENPDIVSAETLNSLTVRVYHYFMDTYGEQYSKDDAKEVAFCLRREERRRR